MVFSKFIHLFMYLPVKNDIDSSIIKKKTKHFDPKKTNLWVSLASKEHYHFTHQMKRLIFFFYIFSFVIFSENDLKILKSLPIQNDLAQISERMSPKVNISHKFIAAALEHVFFISLNTSTDKVVEYIWKRQSYQGGPNMRWFSKREVNVKQV